MSFQSKSLLNNYSDLIDKGEITRDPSQSQALEALNELCERLNNPTDQTLEHMTPQGVYMWGSVGRGKTMLMNLLFQTLPEGIGKRQHFHHFMSALHRELNTTFGVVNPIDRIAERMAQEIKVLCFDEFFVSDIADAMLLGNFTKAFFKHGGHLVATSNIPIPDLFDSMLDKNRFDPVVENLQQHLLSCHLSGEVDHRFRAVQDQKIFYTDLSEFQTQIEYLFQNKEESNDSLLLNHRQLPVLAKSDRSLWCKFEALCEQPRSAQDYIALAKEFDCIVVSNIPELSNTPYETIKARGTEDGAIGSGSTGNRVVALGINDDAVRRFISLIDECYDQGIKMYFHAEVPLERLYQNGILLFEFQRTFSRMSEMQTKVYKTRCHSV